MATTADLLLITLVNSSQPFRVSELKRAIHGGIQKKEVNALLYSLQDRGLVERTVENPPLWSATVAATSTLVLEISGNSNDGDQGTTLTRDEHTLVSILMEHGKEHGMSAGSTAAFLGKSVALTNKMLYGLERNTRIIRRSRTSPPLWKIQSSDSYPMECRGSSSSDNSSSSSSSDSSSSSSSPKSENEKNPSEGANRSAQINVACHGDNSDDQIGKRAKVNLNIETNSTPNPNIAGCECSR